TALAAAIDLRFVNTRAYVLVQNRPDETSLRIEHLNPRASRLGSLEGENRRRIERVRRNRCYCKARPTDRPADRNAELSAELAAGDQVSLNGRRDGSRTARQTRKHGLQRRGREAGLNFVDAVEVVI